MREQLIIDTATLTNSAFDKQVAGTHYKDMPIQPSMFIHRNGIGFLAGCAIKYLCRYKRKNGKQDLDKAIHFIELLREEEYPEVVGDKGATK